MSSPTKTRDKDKDMWLDTNILFSDRELCESLSWLIKEIADPIKFGILKEVFVSHMTNEEEGEVAESNASKKEGKHQAAKGFCFTYVVAASPMQPEPSIRFDSSPTGGVRNSL